MQTSPPRKTTATTASTPSGTPRFSPVSLEATGCALGSTWTKLIFSSDGVAEGSADGRLDAPVEGFAACETCVLGWTTGADCFFVAVGLAWGTAEGW